jgi:NAD(P)H-dependent FMN reductase/catechol 2,3-dioxygenase-like lactoylglutathione lyase family enzyme
MIGSVERLFEAHLTVRDLARSIAFYRDCLGLELAHTVTEKAAFFWVGTRGLGMLGLWAAGASPQRVIGHIAFTATLADVLSAPKALEDHGVTPLDFDGRPATEPIVLAWMPAASVYFRDPDGHLLEFIAMLDDEPQRDGGVMPWTQWARRRDESSRVTQKAEHSSSAQVDTAPPSSRVLAISGSLREKSSNHALVEAAAQIAPPTVAVSIYRELSRIPPFNPDCDAESPAPVRRFRDALASCDAVLISSPEYAHGVSGVLKNALDWIVGTGELIDKPVALLNASARATHAHAALRETLITMSARVIDEASPVIPLDGKTRDAARIASDANLSAVLADALAALVRASVSRGRPSR